MFSRGLADKTKNAFVNQLGPISQEIMRMTDLPPVERVAKYLKKVLVYPPQHLEYLRSRRQQSHSHV